MASQRSGKTAAQFARALAPTKTICLAAQHASRGERRDIPGRNIRAREIVDHAYGNGFASSAGRF